MLLEPSLIPSGCAACCCLLRTGSTKNGNLSFGKLLLHDRKTYCTLKVITYTTYSDTKLTVLQFQLQESCTHIGQLLKITILPHLQVGRIGSVGIQIRTSHLTGANVAIGDGFRQT